MRSLLLCSMLVCRLGSQMDTWLWLCVSWLFHTCVKEEITFV